MLNARYLFTEYAGALISCANICAYKLLTLYNINDSQQTYILFKMKKKTIWILTIIMALTFCGLLYIQIMYMKNMIRMRDDQFAEGVRRSLYAVTSTLEQDETRHFLEEDAAAIEQSVYGSLDTGSKNSTSGSMKYSFTTPDGLHGDLTIHGDLRGRSSSISPTASGRYRSLQETIKGQYLYQKGLLNEVILNILSQSSNRPIAERADSATVARYLAGEFETTGSICRLSLLLSTAPDAQYTIPRDSIAAMPGATICLSRHCSPTTRPIRYIILRYISRPRKIISCRR